GIRCFHVTGVQTCALPIYRAGSGGGAGIYNRFGTVTLNESIVTGNESSNQRGGGILNDGGILTLVGSRVERNQTGVHGGGIYYRSEERRVGKESGDR